MSCDSIEQCLYLGGFSRVLEDHLLQSITSYWGHEKWTKGSGTVTSLCSIKETFSSYDISLSGILYAFRDVRLLCAGALHSSS